MEVVGAIRDTIPVHFKVDGDGGVEDITLQVDMDTPLDGSSLTDVFCKARDIPAKAILRIVLPDSIPVKVTKGDSLYDATTTGHLAVSKQESLAQFFKNYRRHHQLLSRDGQRSTSSLSIDAKSRRSKSGDDVDYKEYTIDAGPAVVKLQRTLRVPDNASKYILPPGLGTFPLEPVHKYARNLEPGVAERGGYLMPMFQREAMWIDFTGSGDCAIKVSIGGINAVTGHPFDEPPPEKDTQDYVVAPQQPWLDGICVAPGVIRQFVAVKLGHGYTVEEQLTGEARHGGIQIDVLPSLVPSVKFQNSYGNPMDISSEPRGIRTGSKVMMQAESLPPIRTLREYSARVASSLTVTVIMGGARRTGRGMQIHVKKRNGEIITFDTLESSDTIDHLKAMIEDVEDILPFPYRLVFDGQQLEDGWTLSDYNIGTGSTVQLVLRVVGGGYVPLEDARMGLAAGGQIRQTIYADTKNPVIYDEDAAERVWIHTVSTAAWEKITGVVPPMTPIVPGTYALHDYPWFDLYDEHMPALPATGAMDRVRPIAQLDGERPAKRARLDAPAPAPAAADLLDPDHPPACSVHARSAALAVLRPCGHFACAACVGAAMFGGGGAARCAVRACRAAVVGVVGFKTPAARVEVGAGSTGEWWKVEAAIEGVGEDDVGGRRNVATLVLEKDRVSRLHNAAVTTRRGRRRR